MLKTRTLLAILGVALSAPTVSASGTISNALSAREAGRGGANIGFSDNGVVLMDNPAGIQGLVGHCSHQDSYVDLGGVGLFTDMTYSDADNPTVQAVDDPSGLAHFTIARRLNDDWVIGFGAYTPAGFASEYDLQGPAAVPGLQNYKSFGALIRVLPGLSVQLTERLSVGGTLGVAASHVEIEGPYFLNSLPLTGTPTRLDLQSTGAALSWSTGLQYELTEATTLGVRYQSANEFDCDAKARVAINPIGISHYDVDFEMTWARSLGLGIMHRLSPHRRIGIDVEWEDWSDAYDQVNLTFTNPSSLAFLGAAGPQINEVFPLRWEDSIVVSAGYEHDLCRHRTVRLGYRYQDNPIPAAATTTYLQTTLEHHFSIGYGFQHRGWEFDTAYQYAFAPSVSTGASIYPGGDFSDAKITTETHMVFFGGMRRF